MTNVTDQEIHAFLDGELSPTEHKQFQQRLLDDTVLQKRLAEIESLNRSIKHHFDQQLIDSKLENNSLKSWILNFPEPTAIPDTDRENSIDSEPSKELIAPSKFFSLKVSGAIAAMFVLGFLVGFMVDNLVVEQSKARDNWVSMVANYQGMYWKDTLPDNEASIKLQQKTSQRLSTYFSKHISIPDLKDFGAPFKRGQILHYQKHPLAQLVYLYKDKQPLALCMISRESLSDQELINMQSYGREFGQNYVAWVDETFAYVLVGDIPPKKLKEVSLYVQTHRLREGA